MSSSFRAAISALTPNALSQILTSGTNFVLSLLAAHTVSPSEFGKFSAALGIAYGVLALNRSVFGEPLTVLLGAGDDSRGTHFESASVVLATVTGAVGGLVVSGLALFGWGHWVVVLGAGLGAAALEDALRYLRFAQRRPYLAARMDLTWLLVTCSLLTIVAAVAELSLAGVVAAWAIGALTAALTSSFVPSLPMRQSLNMRAWFRSTSGLGLHSGVQSILSSVLSQLTPLLLIPIIGATAVGGIRSVQLLYTPAAVILSAVSLALLPRFAGKPRQDIRRLLPRLTIRSCACGVIYGLVIVLIAPMALLYLFGQGYESYAWIAFPLAMALFFQAAAPPLAAAMRALLLGRQILLSQVVTSFVGIPVLLLLALSAGLGGAAWGLALQSGLNPLTSAMLFSLSGREEG